MQLKKNPLRFVVGSELSLNEQYRAIYTAGLLLSTSTFFSVCFKLVSTFECHNPSGW